MLWHRFGLLGLLGILLIAAWLIGFLALGFHDGLFHLLLPVGALCLVVQYVRRLAA
ncbi:MAG TPA: hypothetical protein VFS08_18610 [Gemmatimonadaceae bacterium]|nr:hypothetical protein [Gemmatimonadaceae bacterium]